MKILITFLFAFCTITTMAQKTYDAPEIIYRDGAMYQCFTSDKASIIISISEGAPLRGFSKNPVIHVLVKNIGNTSILVDPSQITAVTVDGEKKKEVEVYSQKKIASKVKNKIKWFGPNDKENVQVKTNITQKDQYGFTKSTTEGTTTTQVYTGAASEEIADATNFIDKTYLKISTVMPNDTYTGSVISDKVKSGTLFVTICVGEDKFVSSFKMGE